MHTHTHTGTYNNADVRKILYFGTENQKQKQLVLLVDHPHSSVMEILHEIKQKAIDSNDAIILPIKIDKKTCTNCNH